MDKNGKVSSSRSRTGYLLSPNFVFSISTCSVTCFNFKSIEWLQSNNIPSSAVNTIWSIKTHWIIRVGGNNQSSKSSFADAKTKSGETKKPFAATRQECHEIFINVKIYDTYGQMTKMRVCKKLQLTYSVFRRTCATASNVVSS